MMPADNCPLVSTTQTRDTDHDGNGDAWIPDDDGDGVVDRVIIHWFQTQTRLIPIMMALGIPVIAMTMEMVDLMVLTTAHWFKLKSGRYRSRCRGDL